MNPEQKMVLVRMPSELYETVKACARVNDRSMAAEVRVAIQRYLKKRGVL